MTFQIRAARAEDLPRILGLQRQNLEAAAGSEAATQGFVTVRHDEETLRRMHDLAPSVVAEHDGTLAGYALTMLPEAKDLVPVLRPMFEQLSKLSLPRFYVMGQICVAREHRKSGVFDALYAEHRALYAGRFDAVVTEISIRNARSLRAHARVGFVEVHRYRDATDEWSVVAWEFAGGKGPLLGAVGVDGGVRKGTT
jgi:predicted GNAT superfamily acetyltransferase